MVDWYHCHPMLQMMWFFISVRSVLFCDWIEKKANGLGTVKEKRTFMEAGKRLDMPWDDSQHNIINGVIKNVVWGEDMEIL